MSSQKKSLVNSTKHLSQNNNLSWNISRNIRRIISHPILWDQYYLDTKMREKHHKKRNIQTNNLYEYRDDNPQQSAQQLKKYIEGTAAV